jgi:hypothetical protein
VSLPHAAASVTTMLSEQERRLLYWLASNRYSGVGAIVDAGCFLGGSTLALAEGLRRNPARPPGQKIDVYDLFDVDPYMAETFFREVGPGRGESFRALFDENTRDVRDLISVHEGDLARLGWTGDPIEILFVDIAKSWEVNDVLVRDFFPSLIPERSVLVQQDFVWGECPWIAITMEHLADYFEQVAYVEYATVVFVCRKPIPRIETPASLVELPLETKLSLLDQAASRFEGYPRAVVESGKAAVLAEEGRPAEARAHIDRIRREYADHERVLWALDLQGDQERWALEARDERPEPEGD